MIQLSSANLQFWDFLISGGIFMLFIMLCCFVAIAVSIHRALTLRSSSIVPKFLKDELARCDQYFKQEKSSALYHALRKSNTPVGNIGEVALSSEFSNRAEASEAVEATAKEELVKLEGGMGILEVVITIAPLLGLLGTVSGLVKVFATLGATDAGTATDPTLIAAGIATALNTTIAGLVVAVITVILHSYFTRRLESISAQLEKQINNMLHQFYKYGGPRLYAKEAAAAGKAKSTTTETASSQESSVQGGILQSRIPKST
ncbi:MAG: MotA/TolQ/ExbB proton channel family protein [Verrucomicrobiales bacterium]|nr:MotA/TolQ/ExbB proton channel family protein [Verrucomicrobiales bacterium]